MSLFLAVAFVILALSGGIGGLMYASYLIERQREDDRQRRKMELIERGIYDGSGGDNWITRVVDKLVVARKHGPRRDVLTNQASRIAELERQVAALRTLAERVDTLETIAIRDGGLDLEMLKDKKRLSQGEASDDQDWPGATR
ncbi:MAG: hypothetical protein HYV63_29920 [Candidatus Schekmanbacteria bacterium]|nr:hypothetical protein [Candidatus Schekmanbacteria bacterium]